MMTMAMAGLMTMLTMLEDDDPDDDVHDENVADGDDRTDVCGLLLCCVCLPQ